LVVYRDSQDEVRFIELAPMSFQLLQTIQNKQTTSIAHCLAAIFPDSSSQALKDSATQALQQFIDKQIVILDTQT
ncbi:MAG: hypothetical protein KAJ63_06485, partial [Methyloprofundus sp.]|nr:hypothetical protein [Methyloprofundus sp.]